MKTIELIPGVRLTATVATFAQLDAEKNEMALVRWLADPANRTSEEYSDIYKDVYGIRPRW